MPTTRSSSKKQASLEEYGVEHSTKDEQVDLDSANENAAQPGHSRTTNKRKRVSTDKQQQLKKSKSKPKASTTRNQENERTDSTTNNFEKRSIVINRSPVLQLWAAVVAGFLYPNETWDTCLSIGGAISTLCAISKGRAIGKVEPKDTSAEELEARDRKRQQTKKEVNRTLDVMGFDLDIKDGVVIVSGKPKPVKESLLQGKFGGEDEYTNVKQVMENALRIWSDDKERLDKKAFSMYESFRPGVAAGSSGWGRKGELKMDKVKDTIESRR